MKNFLRIAGVVSLALLARISCVAAASSTAQMSLPAYGVVCKASDGSMVTIVPLSNQSVAIEVADPTGRIVSDNNFSVLSSGNIFIFPHWVEMGQIAVLGIPHDETMRDSYFRFEFDARKELGVADLYSCDVM